MFNVRSYDKASFHMYYEFYHGLLQKYQTDCLKCLKVRFKVLILLPGIGKHSYFMFLDALASLVPTL